MSTGVVATQICTPLTALPIIAFQPSVQVAVLGLAISVIVGLLAGIVPGWQAAGTEIVKALREI